MLKRLPEGFSGKKDELGGEYAGIKEGHNDWKVSGWRGPKLPSIRRFRDLLLELPVTALDQKQAAVDFMVWPGLTKGKMEKFAW
jgi:hypothetical protein